MSRGLWFVAGAGAGIYAAVRARRAAEILTVDGLRDRVGAAAVGARMFRDEVAQGRAQAETGLRQRLGGLPDGHRELAGEHPSAGPGAPPPAPESAERPPRADHAAPREEGTP